MPRLMTTAPVRGRGLCAHREQLRLDVYGGHRVPRFNDKQDEQIGRIAGIELGAEFEVAVK